MRLRLPILLLLVYVVLDFGNPLMPGAVNFGADESMEGCLREYPDPGHGAVRRRLAPSQAGYPPA